MSPGVGSSFTQTAWRFVGYGRVVAERERKNAGGFKAGDANDGRVKKMGEGKRRAKSGSPCAACGSKTRSSFLHLQVECRDIRDSPHCCGCRFSIPDFPSLVFLDCRFRFCVRPVGNHCEKDDGNYFTRNERRFHKLSKVKRYYIWRDRLEIFLVLKCNRVWTWRNVM